MAQVDASRFLNNLHSLFAPTINDGQEFTAYIDGEANSLVIQGENILYPSSGKLQFGDLAANLDNSSKLILALQNKADALEDLCRAIPSFISKIDTINGEFDGIPDFQFDILYFNFIELRDKLTALEEKINSLEALFYSNNQNGADITSLNLGEKVSLIEYKIEVLQEHIDNLSAEFHSRVISENEFNLSE